MMLIPTAAHAQTVVNQTTHDPSWTMVLSRPDQADDGFYVECAYPASGCQQFNKAMCDITKPYQLTVTRAASSPTFTGAVTQFTPSAWLQRGSGVCSTYDPNVIASIPGLTQGTWGTGNIAANNSSIFYGGATSLVIPDSFGGGAPITTHDIMNAFPDVCNDPNGDGTGGINFTLFRVCFGISQAAIINNTVASGNGNDVTGYWQFPVDTRPPEPPNIDTAKSLVSRVSLNMSFANSAEDMYQVNVRFTSDPNLVNATDCSTWGTAQTTSLVVAPTDTSGSITIPGTNGVTYAYCAQALDLLGNGSAFGNVITASPHPECDYFDCYPGDLQVGFCAAGLPPEWYALAVTAWLYRRARRRQT